ncbi:hypothetical protein FOL46_006164 [Perkinsus olseni]|uniref:PH domain-containing protein n=1 Tax=Perkinsus olseni TaxID=32597 RepID=A0A7J6LM99_PEROL|nr:hypothetical protein FOL46_006164 [Perkinsus olseni]
MVKDTAEPFPSPSRQKPLSRPDVHPALTTIDTKAALHSGRIWRKCRSFGILFPQYVEEWAAIMQNFLVCFPCEASLKPRYVLCLGNIIAVERGPSTNDNKGDLKFTISYPRGDGTTSVTTVVEFMAGSLQERESWVAALATATADLNGDRFTPFVTLRAYNGMVERAQRTVERISDELDEKIEDDRERFLRLLEMTQERFTRRSAFFAWARSVRVVARSRELLGCQQLCHAFETAVIRRKNGVLRVLSINAKSAAVEETALGNCSRVLGEALMRYADRLSLARRGALGRVARIVVWRGLGPGFQALASEKHRLAEEELRKREGARFMGTWMNSVFHRSALYRALHRLRLSTLVGRLPRQLTVRWAPGVVCLPDRESSRVAQAHSSSVDSGEEEEEGKVRYGSDGKVERDNDSGADEGGRGGATVTERREKSLDDDDDDDDDDDQQQQQQLAEGSEGGNGDHAESEEVQGDACKESEVDACKESEVEGSGEASYEATGAEAVESTGDRVSEQEDVEGAPLQLPAGPDTVQAEDAKATLDVGPPAAPQIPPPYGTVPSIDEVIMDVDKVVAGLADDDDESEPPSPHSRSLAARPVSKPGHHIITADAPGELKLKFFSFFGDDEEEEAEKSTLTAAKLEAIDEDDGSSVEGITRRVVEALGRDVAPGCGAQQEVSKVEEGMERSTLDTSQRLVSESLEEVAAVDEEQSSAASVDAVVMGGEGEKGAAGSVEHAEGVQVAWENSENILEPNAKDTEEVELSYSGEQGVDGSVGKTDGDGPSPMPSPCVETAVSKVQTSTTAPVASPSLPLVAINNWTAAGEKSPGPSGASITAPPRSGGEILAENESKSSVVEELQDEQVEKFEKRVADAVFRRHAEVPPLALEQASTQNSCKVATLPPPAKDWDTIEFTDSSSD